MRTLICRNTFVTAIALIHSSAHAFPPTPRQVAGDALDPWVSVDPNGNAVATITPFVSTINGAETVISGAPTSLTATATSGSEASRVPASSGAVLPTSTGGGGAFKVCHNKGTPIAPFCKPDNGTVVYVGETYYVTWDPNYLAELNSTILIEGNYVKVNGTQGSQAYESPFMANSLGFLSLAIDNRWLLGLPSVNITLSMFQVNSISSGPSSFPGPTLMVTTRPVESSRQEKSSSINGLALYIALPLVLIFVAVVVFGLWRYNRKTRGMGLGSVIGRGQGYGVRQSRGQRLGLGKGKDDIVLREQELTAGGQFRDRATLTQ